MIVMVLTGVSLFVACGMRGPPRAPLIYAPNAVGDFEVLRVEDRVYLRFSVPETNTDGSFPPDLDRLEVYALTTDPEQAPLIPPPLEDWIEAATLVATLPVDLPEFESETADEPAEEGSVALGAEVSLVEVLTPELLVPFVFEDELEGDDEDEDDELDDTLDTDEAPPPMPLVSPPLPQEPRRGYLVRGISTRGREGAPSPRIDVPIHESPSAPLPPSVTYTQDELVVEWSPAPGARLPIQELAPDDVFDVLPSEPVIDVPTPSTYLVYAARPGLIGETSALPPPLNTAEVGELSYVAQGVPFGLERCFVVRTLDVRDTLEIQGPASPPTCVVPEDTFPPAPPRGVVAVASEGAISLVWDPSPEPDIAGYMVLRRTPAGATLERLTPEPLEGTSFRDEDVEPTERYIYAVQALDRATPPNVSSPSTEVTEQAR